MTHLSDPVSEIADRYVTASAALDPCRAALMGVAGQDDRLTDYSPAGFAARRDLAERTLAELPAGEGASVAARAMRGHLEAELALHDAGVADIDLGVLDGPLGRLRGALEVLDRGAETPWTAVEARLRALPGVLAGLRETLAAAAAQGRVTSRRQVLLSAQACAKTAAYAAAVAGRHPSHGLDEVAASAGAALEELRAYLTGDLAGRAPDKDGVGADHYALAVAAHLGMRLDAPATYAWAWSELARIREEMDTAAERIAPGEPLKAVFTALDEDPAYRAAGPDAFRGMLQELADRAIADLDGVHFDIPEPLRRIDCQLTDSGGIYYLAPAEDLSRPGQMWWTLTPGPIITWHVPAIMYHEGVPGHHLQLGSTVLDTRLNRFQRVGSELFPGYGEGWGLYAERLMDELGYYDDPAHRLGMLAGGQQMRTARVILDIGLHLGLSIPEGTGFHEGERWTRDLAVEFLRRHSGPESEESLTFEVDRYLGWPAQAIAYKMGERVWVAGRDTARARPGFDLKDFHARALALGPMGLDLLAQELAVL